MPGYQLEIFDIKIEDKYLCSACRLALREPFQTYCGHRYCKSCLDEIFRLPGIQVCKQCPQDAQFEDSLLKSDQAFPDRAIKRDIGELPVKCRNEEACEWKGKVQQYVAHQETCEFGLIPCPKQGCGKQVMRMDLAAHLEKECAVRQVKCKYCAQEILLKEDKVHRESCSFAPVRCEWCRKEDLNLALLQKHQHPDKGDCPGMKIPCTFAPVGCMELVDRRHIGDHHQKFHLAHQTMLVNKIQHQRQETESLSRNMDAVFPPLQQKIQDMEAILSQLTQPDAARASQNTRLPSSFPTDVAEQLLSPQVQNDTHLAERQQVSLPATTADSNCPEQQQGNNPPETALNAASQTTNGAPMQATNGAPGPMQETTDPVILHGRITELEKEVAVLNNLVGVLRKDREMLSHALDRQA